MNVTTAPPPTSRDTGRHRAESDPAIHIAALREAKEAGAFDAPAHTSRPRETAALLRLLGDSYRLLHAVTHQLIHAEEHADRLKAMDLALRNRLRGVEAELVRERRRAEICRRYADEIAAQARDLNAENRVMRANRETDQALIADLQRRLAAGDAPQASRRAHGRRRRSR